MLAPKITALKSLFDEKFRFRTWWVHVALLVAVLLPVSIISYFLIGYICFLALKDYLTLVSNASKMDRSAIIVPYLCMPMQIYWAATGQLGLFIFFLPAIAFGLLFGYLLLFRKATSVVTRLGPLVWAMLLPLFGLSHLVFLVSKNGGVNWPERPYSLFLILLILLTVVGRYVVHAQQKRFPLLHKSWAEWSATTLIALVVTTGLAQLLSWLYPNAGALVANPQPQELVALGILAGTAVYIGNFFVAKLQTRMGILASYRLQPGYGGILTQTASYMFTVPVLFYILRFV